LDGFGKLGDQVRIATDLVEDRPLLELGEHALAARQGRTAIGAPGGCSGRGSIRRSTRSFIMSLSGCPTERSALQEKQATLK
jgi:hypothetical protein